MYSSYSTVLSSEVVRAHITVLLLLLGIEMKFDLKAISLADGCCNDCCCVCVSGIITDGGMASVEGGV